MQLYITYSVLISAVIQVATSITNIEVISAYNITQSKVTDWWIHNNHSCHWDNFQKGVSHKGKKREHTTQDCSSTFLHHPGLAQKSVPVHSMTASHHSSSTEVCYFSSDH